jgi:Saxitoxin biosynthesis operon protein SxtJ
MKLHYKEDPKEWRKSTLLALLGLTILSSLLCWRHHLSREVWYAALALLGVVAIASILQPRWFRGWYRLSLRLGFYSSQFIGRCVLALFFIFVVTPLGWVLRLAGKDPLQLKRPSHVKTYWRSCNDCSPLDRLF